MSRRDTRDVRELIEARGAKAAAQALIEVCEDPKAPAPARATAGTALLRAAGMFDKESREDDKPLWEMDGNELERKNYENYRENLPQYVKWLEEQQAKLAAEVDPDDEDEGDLDNDDEDMPDYE